MTFADKIIQLRKQRGWSQEELAEQLDVSRQSVSKWEGGLSLPDLNKILQLSSLFSVSTDYLLKDDYGEEHPGIETKDTDDWENHNPLRRVSMDEAMDFLSLQKLAGKRIVLAVFLCVLSPVCLLLSIAATEAGLWSVSENMPTGLGLVTLLLMIAGAVAIFISYGVQNGRFEYLEKELFQTDPSVSKMVEGQMEEYRNHYKRHVIFGICLCILSPLPLFLTISVSENEFHIIASICMLLFVVAIGVSSIIASGVRWSGFQKLLQVGDYSKAAKKKNQYIGAVTGVFWSLIVAIYLGYSFYTNNWDSSWIIWPIAAVLFGAISSAVGALQGKK